MIDKNTIESIKNSISLVETIGSYTQVKKTGSAFKAVCPFHTEKTPSLSINEQKGFWHCFGCGAGGDIIGFIEKIENISFLEAVEKLADKANIVIGKTKDNEEELFNIKLLADYFKNGLQKKRDVLTYLNSRGINDSSIESFNLGYAPESEIFFKFAKEKFLNFEILKKIGVTGEGEGGRVYFRFSNRVIFPIYSKDSQLIAFGGRALGNSVPKYINSASSSIFDKSSTLYGYHLAREHIKKSREAIIVEGYMDVIAMHQMGYKNCVATMGTALSNINTSRLIKECNSIVLAFDSDRAGVEAAKKAALLLALSNQKGYSAFFESGKDAADLLKEGRAELLNECLNKKEPILSFIAKKMFDMGFDESIESKNKVFLEMKEFAQKLSPIFRDEFLDKCSQLLKLEKKYFDCSNAMMTKKESRAGDIGELTFLKSILSSDENLRLFDEYIDNRIFIYYLDFFEYINENKISQIISKCLVDNSIPIISDSELLIDYLKGKIIDYLQSLIIDLKRKEMDFNRKVELIGELSNKVESLKTNPKISIDDISFFKNFFPESLAG